MQLSHSDKWNENNSCGFCPHFATISLCQTPKVTNPNIVPKWEIFIMGHVQAEQLSIAKFLLGVSNLKSLRSR